MSPFSPTPPPTQAYELKLCQQCGIWFVRPRPRILRDPRPGAATCVTERAPVVCRKCASALGEWQQEKTFFSAPELLPAPVRRRVALEQEVRALVKRETRERFRRSGAEHLPSSEAANGSRARKSWQVWQDAVLKGFQAKPEMTAAELAKIMGTTST